MEAQLFLAKVLWSFDLQFAGRLTKGKLERKEIVIERDFKVSTMWEKPEFYVTVKEGTHEGRRWWRDAGKKLRFSR